MPAPMKYTSYLLMGVEHYYLIHLLILLVELLV